jgi:hypothetical protein
MHAERVKKYTYVTATLVEPILQKGEEPDAVRQGIFMGILPERTIIITGTSGEIYRCLPNVQEIEDKNLSPDVRAYLNELRELNR